MQFVEFSIFSERPSYSTPLPDHFPGSLCTPEQVSRCRSSHRRLTKNKVSVQIWDVFRARKRSPRHGKTHFPVQIRFFREGRRPEVCSERGVCHPRKVSGEFRGVVPRPLKPTQTTGFGAKTRLGLVQKWSSGANQELAVGPIFF